MCILWSQSKFFLPTVEEKLSVKTRKQKSDFGYSYFFVFQIFLLPLMPLSSGRLLQTAQAEHHSEIIISNQHHSSASRKQTVLFNFHL